MLLMLFLLELVFVYRVQADRVRNAACPVYRSHPAPYPNLLVYSAFVPRALVSYTASHDNMQPESWFWIYVEMVTPK